MRIYRTQQLTRPDLQAHIYSADLIGNVKALKSLCPDKTKFCAVVKANAYGHGITEIVNILQNADVDFFAVASVYEAIHITPLIKNQPILILEPLNQSQPPDLIHLCANRGYHCILSSIEDIHFVTKTLTAEQKPLNIHVNIESGMNRCGLAPDQALELIKLIDNCSTLKLTGICTHFATADEPDLSYAYEQLDTFEKFIKHNHLDKRQDIIIHAANSAATIKIPKAHFDMVRCGISMYGYYSRPLQNPPIELTPIMKLQAPIVQLKPIPAGCAVSYGCSYVTKRNTVAAIVPLGYADGYLRQFSNNAQMKVGNHFANVIGRVCMDQLIIDVTDVPNPSVGQMVTIIDNELNSPCGAYKLSELADTICYEILTCVHSHVSRIVH